MIRTDTTLGQDRRTESNCVCMCTVQRRVIVDNKCEFQHSSSHSDCNSDARLVSKTRKYQQTDISEIRQGDFRSPTQVQHTHKGRHVHISQSVNSLKTRQLCKPILVQPFQRVKSVKCVSFNPSRASKRPTARVRTQPSPEIRAYPSDPSSRCPGLFK